MRSTLVFNSWNQRLLDNLAGSKQRGGDDIPWEVDYKEEKKQVEELSQDAKKGVEEWRARSRTANDSLNDTDEEEEEDNGDDDDDNVPAVDEVVSREATTDGMCTTQREVTRHRLHDSVLELEREMNESWRKPARASKYLARAHLDKMERVMETMTSEHAEKYLAARAKACAPAAKPVKRPRGRPCKVTRPLEKEAATQGVTDDEEEGKEEGRSEEEDVAVTSAKRPRGRPRKEAVQLSEDTTTCLVTADVESEARADDGSDNNSEEDCGSKENKLS
ncbi:hypothetical protein CBR_g33948 [Chara braunii]|uniref:Uncharacterized protein n=1 Tax=Chara braunii TaxID=69332 RepID=A0A388LHF2_CHABU|nr:hypothetical protein CBR_g33948 [Chara braunii]|eukprot:GBG81770.1 hypothetical protein CBR_g33948 [Chara braunii]